MAATVFLNAAETAAPGIQLRWKADQNDNHRVVVEAEGIRKERLEQLAITDRSLAQWQELLTVVAGTGDITTDINLPPMSGRYQITNDVLRFTPSFPLTDGVRYRATFRHAALPGLSGSTNPVVAATYRIAPTAHVPTTVVSAIYPSSAVVPENLLKFYLHFSAPMSRGNIYDHIHLLDYSGKPVELPFLEIDEELWNPEMTRLTLFLDPGRIKRGVRPLEEVGPSLEAGKSYSLVIGREWQDGSGNSLREPFTKQFKVGPPDREPPDPATWTLQPPAAGSRAAFTVTFPKPMDRALTERVIRIIDTGGHPVKGIVSIGDVERNWAFKPEEPWKPGDYRLQVPAIIEDLAGNNIGKPFDLDLEARADSPPSGSVITLPFTVK